MKKSQMIITFFLVLNIISSCVLQNTFPVVSDDNSITLKAIIRDTDGSEEFFLIIKDSLAKIGINLEIEKLNFYNFLIEILTTRNYDLGFFYFLNSANDPDMIDIYSEDGTMNIFSYNNTLDYSEEYGMGTNEWFLQHGLEMIPINSTERINHYWEWQEYLMSELLPCQPIYIFQDHCFNWNNLRGFDYKKGIIQSWGQMFWDGTHPGQSSLDELVVSSIYETNLTIPEDILQKDNLEFDAIMDSLLYYDYNKKLWPHLAEDWWMINTTHIRMKLREDVKWQSDIDGNFTNEYLDTEDVYFTYYLLKNQFVIDWLKDMKIINEYIIDFFIDREMSSPSNEPGSQYFDDFRYKILPEYYLNQTQLPDGKTPEFTHIAWEKFVQKPFGTGLFEINTINENEIILTIFNETWHNDSLTINDKRIDWINRFGDQYKISNLKIKRYEAGYNYLTKFEAGELDLIEPSLESEIEYLLPETSYNMSTKLRDGLMMIFYNLSPKRTYIGNNEPCEADQTISKGLAIRKAISYAIDRGSIVTGLKGVRYVIDDYPMLTKQGIWCSPDITRYNYDLLKAQDYFILAMGRPSTTQSNQQAITWIFLSITFVTVMTIGLKKRK